MNIMDYFKKNEKTISVVGLGILLTFSTSYLFTEFVYGQWPQFFNTKYPTIISYLVTASVIILLGWFGSKWLKRQKEKERIKYGTQD